MLEQIGWQYEFVSECDRKAAAAAGNGSRHYFHQLINFQTDPIPGASEPRNCMNIFNFI
jgi:hypothetical protein